MEKTTLPVRALRAHRARLEEHVKRESAAVLVPSGLPVPIPGTDQFHAFDPHPEHFWLTGLSGPGSVLAMDPDGSVLFARVATQADRVWDGNTLSLEEIADDTGVAEVRPRSDLSAWLDERGSPVALLGDDDLLRRSEAYECEDRKIEIDADLTARLRATVVDARRTKDRDELDLMRRAADATASGHAAGMLAAGPGRTEIELRTEIEVEFLRAGAEGTAYFSTVGTGPNSAVLHYTPSRHAILDGDLVLVDAGARYGGYRCDVTRTFPGGKRMSPEQADLYDLVLHVQEAAIAGCLPGREYRELHLEACVGLARGLVDLGYLRGDAESLVERDAHALFFPHGLGHMIGIGTHDVGGYLEGRERSDRFGLCYLRTDLPLAEGHVVTIEPGLYFIPALLDDPARRETFADAVNWDRIDGMLDFGGIRIEDDVLVTADGPEVLTEAIPKEREAMRALRNE